MLRAVPKTLLWVLASVFCPSRAAAQIPIVTVHISLPSVPIFLFLLRIAAPKCELDLYFYLSIYIISILKFILLCRVIGRHALSIVHIPLGCGLDFGVKIRCSLYLWTGIVLSLLVTPISQIKPSPLPYTEPSLWG